MELITLFLRDALLLRERGGEIVNADLFPLIEKEASRSSRERLMDKIRLVEETRRALLRNVNPRLAMEVLLMRLAGEP